MGRRKKRMEQEKEKLPLGTIYQAKEGGNYYLRYQIQGKRKNVNLETDDYEKAWRSTIVCFRHYRPPRSKSLPPM